MSLKRVIAGLLIGVCTCLLPVFTLGTEALHDSAKRPVVFSTWDGFEVDKLASIWLIKRFIFPGAKVHLYPKGEVIREGIQFDTPDSKISRKYNSSTFESLLEHYRIGDEKLIHMGRLIHDIEINTWEPKIFQQSREIEIIIMDLLDRYGKNNELIIKRASLYFDELYQNFPKAFERKTP